MSLDPSKHGRYPGYLKEAQDIASLSVVSFTGGGMADLCCQRRALAKSPVLYSRCEEGRRECFLPEIKTADLYCNRIRRVIWGDTHVDWFQYVAT
jgi:hypothetical protein